MDDLQWAKNWPTKGQILLVSQIVAEVTRGNLWEVCITKVDILLFVVPNNKYVAFLIDFILSLESGQSMGQFFFLSFFSFFLCCATATGYPLED